MSMLQPHKELVARGNLRAVNATRTPTRAELLAHAGVEDVSRLPAERQALVREKEKVCVWLLSKAALGISLNHACKNLLLLAELGEGQTATDQVLCDALAQTACGEKTLPTRSTVLGWVAAYRRGGAAALASGHWSRAPKTRGWEALALEIYGTPGQPSMAAVARDLKRKHGFDCTVEQVRGYLSALPSHLGAHSAARIGKHLFKQVEATYVRRSTEDLMVGDIYMADGYRADVYLAHPVTGNIWRPEIMHVIDLKAPYLVGYRVMANEGTYDVMMGWAEIFARHDHVPPMLYVDNGAGYANKLAADEMSGYYRRAGVQRLIRSLPKNAKGKGNIERYHRVVRDDFLKTWRPAFYCGPDMAKDALDVTTREVKAGRLTLPTLAEFTAAYDAWIAEDYHQRPSRDDKKRTRAQVFADLAPIAPHASAQEIARPCQERVVRKGAVQLNNREYGHPDLIGWNHRTVWVEFDIFAHGAVTVRDTDGHLICDAPLVKVIGMVSDSILQDTRQKALEAKSARIEKKAQEARDRAGRIIDAEAVATGALPALEGEATLIDEDDTWTLDITDID